MARLSAVPSWFDKLTMIGLAAYPLKLKDPALTPSSFACSSAIVYNYYCIDLLVN